MTRRYGRDRADEEDAPEREVLANTSDPPRRGRPGRDWRPGRARRTGREWRTGESVVERGDLEELGAEERTRDIQIGNTSDP